MMNQYAVLYIDDIPFMIDHMQCLALTSQFCCMCRGLVQAKEHYTCSVQLGFKIIGLCE